MCYNEIEGLLHGEINSQSDQYLEEVSKYSQSLLTVPPKIGRKALLFIIN